MILRGPNIWANYPVLDEGFDAVGEGLAGEIGTLGHPAHGKAHVIDHQIAAARTGQAVPADPCLAVLEMVGTGRPLNDGDRLAVLTTPQVSLRREIAGRVCHSPRPRHRSPGLQCPAGS